MKFGQIALAAVIVLAGGQAWANNSKLPAPTQKVDCYGHAGFAQKTMMHRLSGTTQDQLIKALQATEQKSPNAKVQLNLDYSMIERAFKEPVPKSKIRHADLITNFGTKEYKICEEVKAKVKAQEQAKAKARAKK